MERKEIPISILEPDADDVTILKRRDPDAQGTSSQLFVDNSSDHSNIKEVAKETGMSKNPKTGKNLKKRKRLAELAKKAKGLYDIPGQHSHSGPLDERDFEAMDKGGFSPRSDLDLPSDSPPINKHRQRVGYHQEEDGYSESESFIRFLNTGMFPDMKRANRRQILEKLINNGGKNKLRTSAIRDIHSLIKTGSDLETDAGKNISNWSSPQSGDSSSPYMNKIIEKLQSGSHDKLIQTWSVGLSDSTGTMSELHQKRTKNNFSYNVTGTSGKFLVLKAVEVLETGINAAGSENDASMLPENNAAAKWQAEVKFRIVYIYRDSGNQGQRTVGLKSVTLTSDQNEYRDDNTIDWSISHSSLGTNKHPPLDDIMSKLGEDSSSSGSDIYNSDFGAPSEDFIKDNYKDKTASARKDFFMDKYLQAFSQDLAIVAFRRYFEDEYERAIQAVSNEETLLKKNYKDLAESLANDSGGAFTKEQFLEKKGILKASIRDFYAIFSAIEGFKVDEKKEVKIKHEGFVLNYRAGSPNFYEGPITAIDGKEYQVQIFSDGTKKVDIDDDGTFQPSEDITNELQTTGLSRPLSKMTYEKIDSEIGQVEGATNNKDWRAKAIGSDYIFYKKYSSSGTEGFVIVRSKSLTANDSKPYFWIDSDPASYDEGVIKNALLNPAQTANKTKEELTPAFLTEAEFNALPKYNELISTTRAGGSDRQRRRSSGRGSGGGGGGGSGLVFGYSSSTIEIQKILYHDKDGDGVAEEIVDTDAVDGKFGNNTKTMWRRYFQRANTGSGSTSSPPVGRGTDLDTPEKALSYLKNYIAGKTGGGQRSVLPTDPRTETATRERSTLPERPAEAGTTGRPDSMVTMTGEFEGYGSEGGPLPRSGYFPRGRYYSSGYGYEVEPQESEPSRTITYDREGQDNSLRSRTKRRREKARSSNTSAPTDSWSGWKGVLS